MVYFMQMSNCVFEKLSFPQGQAHGYYDKQRYIWSAKRLNTIWKAFCESDVLEI